MNASKMKIRKVWVELKGTFSRKKSVKYCKHVGGLWPQIWIAGLFTNFFGLPQEITSEKIFFLYELKFGVLPKLQTALGFLRIFSCIYCDWPTRKGPMLCFFLSPYSFA
jgi:hypothetical protein